ncbi:RidA family protein [Sinorhizobium meliloti]|uniref:Enamine deaminase RidA n=1 Tax=Rhizobium meliloti TaxID=382 RepID=A0A2J0YTW8_RHIML|nr:RidA family protein [Sinorhizobium meliloti]PJR09842.1 enamine deaminase RidA [Sinorhizobium meliloti]
MFTVVDTGMSPSKSPVNGTVRAGNMVMMAQVPRDPATGEMITGDMRTQTRRLLSNFKQCVEAAGGSLRDIALITIYVVDGADVAEMNEVYAETFEKPYPCRATVVVKDLLYPGVKVEMVAWATLENAEKSKEIVK